MAGGLLPLAVTRRCSCVRAVLVDLGDVPPGQLGDFGVTQQRAGIGDVSGGLLRVLRDGRGRRFCRRCGLCGRRRRVAATTGQGHDQDDENAETAIHLFLSMDAVARIDTSLLDTRSCPESGDSCCARRRAPANARPAPSKAVGATLRTAIRPNDSSAKARHEFAGVPWCVLHLNFPVKTKNRLLDLICHIDYWRLPVSYIPISTCILMLAGAR